MNIFKYLWDLNDKIGCLHVDSFPIGLMWFSSIVIYICIVLIITTCIVKINWDSESFYPKQTVKYTLQCLLYIIIPIILLIVFLGMLGVVVNLFFIVISISYLISNDSSGDVIQEYLHEIKEIENYNKYKQKLLENYNKLNELNKNII